MMTGNALSRMMVGNPYLNGLLANCIVTAAYHPSDLQIVIPQASQVP
jgi:hypothetical protein